MSTAAQTQPPTRRRAFAPVRKLRSWSRRWWHQLTSMRTALILLLVLALGAVPGSLLPQRNISPEEVNRYFREHPDWAPVADRMWLFDVYSAPWFAAIYLLLFVSLVGCLVPRLRSHVQTVRRKPPDAPARLDLMPQHRDLGVADDRAERAGRAREALRRNRFRTAVRHHDDGSITVSGEKGYLRETGNLLFHFSLLGILVGVAVGSLYGWHGNRLLGEGEDMAFCSSLQQFDEYALGPAMDPTDVPRFCLQLDSFSAEFGENGDATMFHADVRYGTDGAAPTEVGDIEVNHPLNVDGANVFLLGHGYAPVITYTDRYGNSQTSTTPFLTIDGNLTSEGVAMFPDANLDPETGQLDPNSEVAFEGLLVPTVPEQPPYTASIRPELNAPGLILIPYRGDIGLDDGVPKSVYALDPDQVASGDLEQLDIAPTLLRPGESLELDDGSSVTFYGVSNYIVLEVRSDPGEPIVLVSAVLLLLGLLPALLIKRRRVWVRVGGDDRVTAGGLARTEYEGFAEEFTKLTDNLTPQQTPQPVGNR